MEDQCYQRKRLYRSVCGESPWLHEVLPNSSTLDLSQPGIFDVMGHYENTPFREVRWAPYNETLGKAEIPIQRGKYIVSLEEYVDLIFSNYKEVIRKAWNPNKFHVMTCSSGYDSRMMLRAMKELIEEGSITDNYIFFESNGEADLAQDCIYAVGFDKKLIVYNEEEINPNEYHKSSFDFKSAYIAFNGGMVTLPANILFTPFFSLGLKEEDTQVFTYYGGNEMTYATILKERGLNWYFKWHYHFQCATFPLYGEMVHPYYNLELQKVINEYWTDEALTLIKPGDSISKLVLQVKFPELMHTYKMVTNDVRGKGYFTVSDRLLSKIKQDYEESWLYKSVGYGTTTPTNKIDFDPWWGMYGLASLCDHFKDYKINIA